VALLPFISRSGWADVDPGVGLRFAGGNSFSGIVSVGEPVSHGVAVDTIIQETAGVGLGGASLALGVARADRDMHYAKVALDLVAFRSMWRSSWPSATWLGPQVRIHMVVAGGFCGLLWATETAQRLMTCGFTLGFD
jgi:hypothetical protein